MSCEPNVLGSTNSTASLVDLAGQLANYSTCDISDALLALEQYGPGQRRSGGFLADLVNLNVSLPNGSTTAGVSQSAQASHKPPLCIYPAFTVSFRSTSSASSVTAVDAPPVVASNIPPGRQWSDLAEQGFIVVVQQPPDQKCAVVGGIHMLRLFKRGVKGLIVDGRVRDLSAMQEISMPVWAKNTSTVGAAAESKAYAVQVPVLISEVLVEPWDLICIDSAENGVVRIPNGLVGPVIGWLRERGNSEDRILAMVRDGGSVAEAFKKFR